MIGHVRKVDPAKTESGQQQQQKTLQLSDVVISTPVLHRDFRFPNKFKYKSENSTLRRVPLKRTKKPQENV
jgi:hypothetical protein